MCCAAGCAAKFQSQLRMSLQDALRSRIEDCVLRNALGCYDDLVNTTPPWYSQIESLKLLFEFRFHFRIRMNVFMNSMTDLVVLGKLMFLWDLVT